MCRPLESSSTNVMRNVKLLRRMGSDERRYRIMISGSEKIPAGRPREQSKWLQCQSTGCVLTHFPAEVIDFDLASAIINPHYAMPTSAGVNKEIILRRDERMARLSFTNLKHVLKFQQAITGFKAWDSYCEFNVLVSFVVAGRKDPIVEKACIQLWIPKSIDGPLVTNTDMHPEMTAAEWPRRSGTMATTISAVTPEPHARPRNSTSTWADRSVRGPENIPLQRTGRSPTVFSASWPRQTSPGPIESSPPRHNGMIPTSSGHRASPISRKPVPTQLAGSPTRSAVLSPVASSTLSVPQGQRTLSISSNASNPVSANNSNSSGADSHTQTVSTGSNTTGYLHKPPTKPKLVLFTENPKDGHVSFVTIDIDEDTSPNPERCNCRRAGRDGSACNISAIERRKGNGSLQARRYEAKGGEDDWNLARLALNSSASSNEVAWPNLKRVSLKFPTAQARVNLGGRPNQCQCKNKNQGLRDLQNCLDQGHRGRWGEVQEFYRRQVNEYHRVRYESHQQVINEPMN